MKNKYLGILLGIGLWLTLVQGGSACAGDDGSGRSGPFVKGAGTVVLDRQFKIKYGQELTVKGQDLKVKFDSAPEDSRCPKDVTCVWAGDARIMLSVRRGNGEDSTVELHTNGQFAQTGKYQQYVIKLVALDPYPRTSVKVKPSDYVATLLITKV